MSEILNHKGDGRSLRDGLSSASPMEPQGSPPKASIPSVGRYVIWDDGGSWGSNYQARRIEKVTAKQISLARGGYRSRIKLDQVVAVVDEPEEAARLCQSLGGIDGEFQRRRKAAEAEASARIEAAREAKAKAVARLLAPAIEAGTAETENTGSVHESAVLKGGAR